MRSFYIFVAPRISSGRLPDHLILHLLFPYNLNRLEFWYNVLITFHWLSCYAKCVVVVWKAFGTPLEPKGCASSASGQMATGKYDQAVQIMKKHHLDGWFLGGWFLGRWFLGRWFLVRWRRFATSRTLDVRPLYHRTVFWEVHTRWLRLLQ